MEHGLKFLLLITCNNWQNFHFFHFFSFFKCIKNSQQVGYLTVHLLSWSLTLWFWSYSLRSSHVLVTGYIVSTAVLQALL